MKRPLLIAVFTVAATFMASTTARGQVAGSTTIGVSMAEVSPVAPGRSVKKSLLGRNVCNDNGQRVGSIDDEKLAEMGRASAKHWKEFESDVSAATAKVRK